MKKSHNMNFCVKSTKIKKDAQDWFTNTETGSAFSQPRNLQVEVPCSFLKKGAVDGEFLHFALCVQFFQPEEGRKSRMHV